MSSTSNHNNFSKQYDIKWIGSFINVLYLTAPLISIGIGILNVATFFAVVQGYMHQTRLFEWVTFPIFFGFIVACGLLMIYLFYKFVYPSYYTFLNQQSYKHNNPIRKDLAEIKEKLGIKDE